MQHDATSRPSTEPVEPPAEDRFAHGVRQTWELEMLISGAVAFALLQLPSAVAVTQLARLVAPFAN